MKAPTVGKSEAITIGSPQIILEMSVQRLKCKGCGAVQQENIHFDFGKVRYTYLLKRYVLVLFRNGTIADVLDGLRLKLKRAGCRMEAVSSDLSEAFI